MNPQTFGHTYNTGRIAPVQCVKEDTLTDLNIKDTCFALIIVYEGVLHFQVRDTSFEAHAPCFLCFDETESPKMIKKRGAKCDSVYFSPTFLNVNMTFSRVHDKNYGDLAQVHDFFLLKPFTDTARCVFPVFDEDLNNFKRLFSSLENQLREQPDWYWSCRSRSYFMEMMLLLERTYEVVGQSNPIGCAEKILNPHLKKAVVYIENNYHNAITLEDVMKAAALNRSSLTQLFKTELGMTPIEYVWHHRIVVAHKFLNFTNLPIKDVALRCGFKTVQHFSRKFEEAYGSNPTAFRTTIVSNRIKSLGL